MSIFKKDDQALLEVKIEIFDFLKDKKEEADRRVSSLVIAIGDVESDIERLERSIKKEI